MAEQRRLRKSRAELAQFVAQIYEQVYSGTYLSERTDVVPGKYEKLDQMWKEPQVLTAEECQDLLNCAPWILRMVGTSLDEEEVLDHALTRLAIYAHIPWQPQQQTALAHLRRLLAHASEQHEPPAPHADSSETVH